VVLVSFCDIPTNFITKLDLTPLGSDPGALKRVDIYPGVGSFKYKNEIFMKARSSKKKEMLINGKWEV
jgi:hypothetical protein